MMGDVTVAPMTDFNIEPCYFSPQFDLFMQAVADPLTPLTIV